MEFFELWYFTR